MKRQPLSLLVAVFMGLGLMLGACGDDSNTSSFGGVTVDEPKKSGTLAKDFPKEVPLVDGDIGESYALSNEKGKSWTVDIAVSDGDAAFEEGLKKLEDAGFTKGFASQDESGGASIWENETYSVIFNVTENDSGDLTAGYLVATLSE